MSNIKPKGKNKGKIVLYRSKIEVKLVEDTVWLSLNQIDDLFERDKSVVSRHLRNIFKEKELNDNSVVAFLQQLLQTEKPIK